MRKIMSMPYTDKGRKRHERIFGKKEEPDCTNCTVALECSRAVKIKSSVCRAMYKPIKKKK